MQFGHNSLQHKHICSECTRDMKVDFFSSLFMSRRIYPPEFVTFGYSPLDGTVTTSKRDCCWPLCWTGLKLGQDCHYYWANGPEQVRSDPSQGEPFVIFALKSLHGILFKVSLQLLLVRFSLWSIPPHSTKVVLTWWTSNTKDKLNPLLFRKSSKWFPKSTGVMHAYLMALTN